MRLIELEDVVNIMVKNNVSKDVINKIENIPMVEAIPVDWMFCRYSSTVYRLVRDWRKEEENEPKQNRYYR